LDNSDSGLFYCNIVSYKGQAAKLIDDRGLADLLLTALFSALFAEIFCSLSIEIQRSDFRGFQDSKNRQNCKIYQAPPPGSQVMHDLIKLQNLGKIPILAPTAFAIRMNCQSHPYFIRIALAVPAGNPFPDPFPYKAIPRKLLTATAFPKAYGIQ